MDAVDDRAAQGGPRRFAPLYSGAVTETGTWSSEGTAWLGVYCDPAGDPGPLYPYVSTSNQTGTDFSGPLLSQPDLPQGDRSQLS